MTTPFGDFGPPPDAAALTALVVAALLALAAAKRTRAVALSAWLSDPRHFAPAVFGLAVLAAGLSFAYVAHYLRGGPRIVDATSYFLQARALAEGHVTFQTPLPSGSFRGRFLLASGDGRALSVVFPPGYPAVLALGFRLGAPLLVGPVTAGLLVAATAALSLEIQRDRVVALLAAALSAVSFVLRYHTADTMSHGWSALLLTVTVAASLCASARTAAVAGASAGALVATRPLTGAVALALALCAARRSPRRLFVLSLAALPPVGLFLLEQRLATGEWLRSTQLAYYAVADGPEGCFRYGFGAGIGCRFEHGDFVRAHLQHGYGLLAALGTTGRRLKMHLADAANNELFAPFVVAALVVAFREKKARLAALGVIGVVLSYAPFYFDGNYPGGGARLFADVLPLEHVLLAALLCRVGLARAALPLALAGFSLHTSYDHLRLQAREGGRPMFEPAVLARARVHRGLVFVDTDHGFSLGYDPAVTSARDGVVVARLRHDAHDAILWARLGRPPAYFYEYAPSLAGATPELSPLTLALPDTLRFEAEAEWPPLAVPSGSVVPSFHPCASRGRALSLAASGGGATTLRLEIPVLRSGRYRVVTGWVTGARGVGATLALATSTFQANVPAPQAGACVRSIGPSVEMIEPSELITISSDSPVSLDYLELGPGP